MIIVLDSKLNTLEHAGYPHTTTEILPDGKVITCLGFNAQTGVGINGYEGLPVSLLEIDQYVYRANGTSYRIKYLPNGYTIKFSECDKLCSGCPECNTFIGQEEMDSFPIDGCRGIGCECYGIDMSPNREKVPYSMDSFPIEDSEPKYTDLQCFEIMVKASKRWWYDVVTVDESKLIREKAGIASDEFVDTLNILRMFLNEDQWAGVEENESIRGGLNK